MPLLSWEDSIQITVGVARQSAYNGEADSYVR